MKCNQKQAVQAILNFQDFKASALSGMNVDGLSCWIDAGRLQGEDKEQFVKDCKAIRYVVRSYATPIAWYARGKWYKVKQKFSPTTSRHQGNLWKIED